MGLFFYSLSIMPSKERKEEYCEKLRALFTKYTKILVVGADNVGSGHMQSIRQSIRGKGVLLMGKNTMVRRVIRTEFEQFAPLLPSLEGNVGLLFSDSDLSELRDTVLSHKVGAPAIAPCSVTIPACDTGLEPTQTAFLQALNIASRINKGQIMILNDVKLIEEGEKVGASQATLLQKLKINPFSYGLTVQVIFDDGSTYAPSVLDLNFDVLSKKLNFAATRIACVSLAIAVSTDIDFERANEIKELLNMDPEALAAMVAASAPAATETKADAPAAVEEEEEESDEDMGFGLFD